ncbi:hypothetical protein P7B02_00100 [Caulobacter segnis]|uniref:hypothetical protein n=1 Tax=Caulobacter segnis TaxID=88688 RepID=UPI0024104FF4|nr:hypothetical protein [Caulobacter segnis]MDG2519921.1 hypothetical protein [Caulobacter segnis]
MDQAASSAGRPSNRETENENLKPDREGEAPRPATEPEGSESSQKTDKTATDPGSGEART